MDLAPVWQVLDERVDTGRFPGYVAAVRVRGQIEVHAGGRIAIGSESPKVGEDTLYRIASVTKPIGGALTMGLMFDGFLSLDDPIDRWVPELASPKVLRTPDAPFDQTEPARSPITVRQLLTMTAGWGAVLRPDPVAGRHAGTGPVPRCSAPPNDRR